MAKATLIFSTAHGPLSWVIRTVLRSKISHTAIGTEWLGIPVILHADVGGVLVVPRTRWLRENTIVDELEAPDAVVENLPKAVAMLHLPYDYVGLLGHLPRIVGRWLRLRLRNPWTSPDKLVCSELVVRACEGSEAFAHLDPEEATPLDVYEAAQAVRRVVT